MPISARLPGHGRVGLPSGPEFGQDRPVQIPSFFLCLSFLASPFPLPSFILPLSECVQLWIDALLRADIPVSDDVVVLLSELAVHRVALDIILRDWEFLALAWDNELCGRHDRTTSRQHGIMADRHFRKSNISSIHNALISTCPHPGNASPPFPSWTIDILPTCFHHSTLPLAPK
jgi:hypothetical protein